MVKIITGIPHEPFEVIKPVMAIGSDGYSAEEAMKRKLVDSMTFGLTAGAPSTDPSAAFERAVAGLGDAGTAAGANAVIGVQFVPRIALSNGYQAFELMAFGTAVRLHAGAARGAAEGSAVRGVAAGASVSVPTTQAAATRVSMAPTQAANSSAQGVPPAAQQQAASAAAHAAPVPPPPPLSQEERERALASRFPRSS